MNPLPEPTDDAKELRLAVILLHKVQRELARLRRLLPHEDWQDQKARTILRAEIQELLDRNK